MTAEQSGYRVSSSLEWHMGHVQMERGFNHLHREMMHAADARRSVIELAGPCSDMCDELTHCTCRHFRVHSEKQRSTRQQRDWLYVLWIVSKLSVDRWID